MTFGKRLSIVVPLLVVGFGCFTFDGIVARAIGAMFLMAAWLTNFIIGALGPGKQNAAEPQVRESADAEDPPGSS